MNVEDASVFDNPWDPTADLIHACYNASQWEGMACSALIAENHEECVYHVINLFGDADGLAGLCGMLEKVFLPLLSTTATDENVKNGATRLSQIISTKRIDIHRLKDLFYSDIYPSSWNQHGAIERSSGIQKWLWKPLILQCQTAQQRHSKHVHSGLSSVAMMTNLFHVATVVSIMRSLLHTILEEDISSQTSRWFESQRPYWKLWIDWSQTFYDDLCKWQETFDKKGSWNTPQGKLCRILRPFSTYFPCLSFFFDSTTLDKCGMVRVFLYHTFTFLAWLQIFTRCIIRCQGASSRGSVSLQSITERYTRFTEEWVSRLSSAGITNLGYYQSIAWADAFIEYRPLPPMLFLWKDMTDPRKRQQVCDFLASVVYQRSMLIDLLESTYSHNDVFSPLLKAYRDVNLNLYRELQTLDLTPAPEKHHHPS